MVAPVTSGTASFLVTRDDIINATLRSLKVISIGQTPDAEDVTNCAFALNLILKSFNIEGFMASAYRLISFNLAATTVSYTIAETGAAVTALRPVKVAHAWRRDNSVPPIDTPLTPLTKQEYDDLTPKTTPGIPVNYYYDPQVVAGVAYFWPVPIDSLSTAYLAVQSPIEDILGAAQNFGLTQEWFLPLRWILSDEVSHEYEVDGATIDRIQARATFWRNKLADFSQEDGSVTMQPDFSSGSGGFSGPGDFSV